jgi:hypothetical protein
MGQSFIMTLYQLGITDLPINLILPDIGKTVNFGINFTNTSHVLNEGGDILAYLGLM